jgi:two-component system, OmpR family, response regulator MtrA
MNSRVLLVEDDPVLTRMLQDNLTDDAFEVRTVPNGAVAEAVAREFVPDLVLLDINLPGPSGFDLCAAWRQRSQVPIILLTANSQQADKVRGLELGADDYITKPFDLEELLARIHAVLRRARPRLRRLQLGDLSVDFSTLTARRGGEDVGFTHRELQILRYLAERPCDIASRDELLRTVWGYTDSSTTRAVDHAIARLRKKIEKVPHRPRYIHTVHGDGYCFTPSMNDD